ncbi:MAG TPA: hypothetical protein VMJ75_02295 [Candidatus Acidoferrales bacterium]|nr:hypothetical protein [Candidatus Acidoferrales bacterium]
MHSICSMTVSDDAIGFSVILPLPWTAPAHLADTTGPGNKVAGLRVHPETRDKFGPLLLNQ